LICWDLAFPEAFRALIQQGAKIIIIPTFWTRSDCSAEGLRRNPASEELFLESALTARAFENTCCVVFVNAGGKEEGGPVGLSQVAMPFVGKMKGSFEGREEGVKVLEVDMEILEEAEANYKVREDMGRADWHYGYSHA
jgi:predicted amidohydrolase